MPTESTFPYLVTTARDGSLKLHRSTCKKATANPTAAHVDRFDAGTPATCCKPRPGNPVPSRKNARDARAAAVAKAPHDPATVPAVDPDPKRRAQLALDERRAVRQAKKAGQPIPPTPNADVVAAEYAEGITHADRVAAPKASRVRRDVQVRFVRDGKPMPDSQNKLSSVAYYHTKGIGSPESQGNDDVKRCTTDTLRAILARHGITDPETTTWGPVTLTNGVKLSAVAL